MAKNKSALPLKWEVFIRKRARATQGVPPGKDDLTWVSNAVTLIYGDSDAVLVDTLLSDQQNSELGDWIEARHKTLRWIYITHAHPDHFFGLALLLKLSWKVISSFPSRSATLTPTTRPVCLCHRSALSWQEMLPTTAHIRFLPSPIMLDAWNGLPPSTKSPRSNRAMSLLVMVRSIQTMQRRISAPPGSTSRPSIGSIARRPSRRSCMTT